MAKKSQFKKKKKILQKIVYFLRTNRLILFVILLAVLVRFTGIIPGHHNYHDDEPMSYGSAVDMILHNDLNPRRFDYPAGVPLLHYLFYKSIVYPLWFSGIFMAHPKYILLALLNWERFINTHSEVIFGKGYVYAIFWSRILTATLGVLSVFLLYMVGRKLYNSIIGLTSAFFLAVNYRHVLSSHIALSDIPNSFFALLAFYMCTVFLEKPKKKYVFLTGLTLGLSFSTKYQIFPFITFFFVCCLLFFRKKEKKKVIFQAGGALVIAGIIFVFLNPYLLLNLSTALSVIHYVSLRYGAGAYRFNVYPLYYLYLWGIGKLPFLLICVGMVAVLWKSKISAMLLYTYTLPFFFTFLYYMTGGTYIRNFTTVMPYLMLFAGVVFSLLYGVLQKFMKGKVLFAVYGICLLVVNYSALRNVVIMNSNYEKQWNRVSLANWVVKNIPDNVQVRNANISLSTAINKKITILSWEHKEINSIEELQDAHDDFAILNTSWYGIYSFWFDTPFDRLTPYNGIPFTVLKNNYYVLALNDFKKNTIKEIYKPWQAPDDNYLILKIPLSQKEPGVELRAFNFDNNAQGWKYYPNIEKKEAVEATHDIKKGNEKTGSISFLSHSSQTTAVIRSPLFPVKAGKVYTVEAFVKPEEMIKSIYRDGFFRIDYYSGKDDSVNENIDHSVSARVFGFAWQKIQFTSQAPRNAKSLTISFMQSLPQYKNNYSIDDVRLFQTDKKQEETFVSLPYIHTTIPDDVLIANSIY